MVARAGSVDSRHAPWSDLAAAAPEIAAAGQRLLFPESTGYAFIGTVRKDGGPRLHPICPVLCAGRLYAFIVDMGYKYRDLLRDPRYALHALPPPAGGEEFYLTGTAQPIADAGIRARVVAETGGRQGSQPFEALFELSIQRVLHTRWENWGTAETWPTFSKWPAP